MTDEAHVGLRKVENYPRNKEEISRKRLMKKLKSLKEKKTNFRKAWKNFSVVNAHLIYKEGKHMSCVRKRALTAHHLNINNSLVFLYFMK